MPQGFGKPVQNTRPTPYRMRQDLGYIPARAMAEGDGGGGITSTGGPTAPVLTLTPIATGTFLGNLTGATAVPIATSFKFINLIDVPASYAGAALKLVRVNAAANALEFITPPLQREVLIADRTYFVRTDGNDANTGLVNNAAGAFLTIAKALTVAASLDCSTFNLTIQCNDGTRTTPVALRTMLGSGIFTLLGNAATPANCIISTTSADAISAIGITATWVVNGFKVQTITSGYGLRAQGFGASIQYNNIDFGACATAHMLCLSANLGQFSVSCTISGSAPIFAQILRLGVFTMFGGTLVIAGTPAFSSSFAQVDSLSLAIFTAATFTGAATGSRFSVSQNAVIQTGTGSLTFLPGNAAGTSATGGQYS